ncbi:50S ribosomal protein L2 [Candidatus Uhrbacteria bacterium]|jgi:large subunit ribosomal protein L2|nr:50S ribosomal protein L2 [Candidatus Uhrbacteria bacterium]
MGIRVHKPTTPGRRKSSVQTFDDVTTSKPHKKLLKHKKQMAGRSHGKIAVRHRGGGAKRHVRQIDWKFDKIDVPATVKTIEYDPNRGARVALISYADGEKRYILSPQGLEVGMKIVTSKEKGDPQVGCRFPLDKIPLGMNIYNIELQPGRGGQIVRGAGTSASLLAVEGKWATLRLPSGEMRRVLATCMASIGSTSNPDWRLIRWGKAGRSRHRGKRPTVRGKAMNPVDHPHGGGEGRNSIGLRRGPKTYVGKLARGVKTRRKRKSDKMIISRRKKRK